MPQGVSTYYEDWILDHMLDGQAFSPVGTVYLSLHTDIPGDAGGSEVTGGSYARQAITWTPAAAGLLLNNGAIDFASMPAETVTHWGIWDAATNGNFLWWGQLDGTPNTFTGADTGDVCTSLTHGLSDTDRVQLVASPGSALPAGYAETILYFVISSTTDTFQLSLTSGGAAVVITVDGEGIAYKVVPKTTNAGDTFRMTNAGLTVSID